MRNTKTNFFSKEFAIVISCQELPVCKDSLTKRLYKTFTVK